MCIYIDILYVAHFSMLVVVCVVFEYLTLV